MSRPWVCSEVRLRSEAEEKHGLIFQKAKCGIPTEFAIRGVYFYLKICSLAHFLKAYLICNLISKNLKESWAIK